MSVVSGKILPYELTLRHTVCIVDYMEHDSDCLAATDYSDLCADCLAEMEAAFADDRS